MFKLFNRNTFATFALLPLLLVLFRLRLILAPDESIIYSDADLYTPMWNYVFGSLGVRASTSIAMALTLVTAYIVNSLTNRFRFTEKQGNLGGMFVVLLSSGFMTMHGLHPAHVFAFWFVISIYRLFVGAPNHRPMRYCFEAAMMLGIGTLFWAKGVWFVPLFFVMVMILRMMELRSLLALLMGLAVPGVLAGAAYCLFRSDLWEVVCLYAHGIFMPVAFFKTNIIERIYLVLMSLLLIASVLDAMRNMQMMKIVESRYMRVMIWVVFYSILLIMLPYFSFEMQMPVSACAAVLVASFTYRLRSSRVAEGITAAVVVMALVMQWFC